MHITTQQNLLTWWMQIRLSLSLHARPEFATSIDDIFTNDLENLATSMLGILVADITDHFPVTYTNTNYSNPEKEITVLKHVSTARIEHCF